MRRKAIMQLLDPDHGSIRPHTSHRWVDSISAVIFFTSTICLILTAIRGYWFPFLWILLLIGVTLRILPKTLFSTGSLIFLGILLLLTSCEGIAAQNTVLELPTPPPKTLQAITTDIQRHWLIQSPCAPPCWEGITPGKTQLQEAISILNKHPLITNIEFYKLSQHDTRVNWTWNHPELGGGSLGFSQDSSDPIIEWINVDYPQSFTLAEIRDVYGDPSHVIPFAGVAALSHTNRSSMIFDLTIIYLDHGFAVRTERELNLIPSIRETMRVTGSITFFAPKSASTDETPSPLLQRFVGDKDFIPWQGFQDFVFYCHQVRPAKDSGQQCPKIDL